MTRFRPLLLALLLTGCRPAPEAPLYVDVRTPAEYVSGHVSGALNIPHDQLALRLNELEPHRERDIIVYCRSGRRSALALEVLRANGFAHVTDGGPLERLVAAGVALE